MPLVLADRVRETTTTAGTGTVTLAGAATGYQTFAAIGNGNTTYYCIAGQGTSEWEVGIGTYTSAGTTLSRDTVLASSAGGAKVTFSAGTKDVFVTYPSGKSINEDASDNVGIGTTTPAAKLDIASGNLLFSSTAQRITGDMSNATQSNRLAFQNSVTNGASVVGTIPNGTGTTSGLRAFGASDPTNANSFSFAQIGASESRISCEVNGTAIAVPMTFHTGGSERVRIDTSGNVGIGTASPASKFDVYAVSGTVTGYIRSAGATGTDIANFYTLAGSTSVQSVAYGNGFGYLLAAASSSFTVGNSSNAPLIFTTNNTERLRIDSSGNVGIGTASPTVALDVVGAAIFTRNGKPLVFNPDYLSAGTRANISTGTGMALAFSTNGDANERMRIDSSGNVGIGTASPGAKLDVVSSGGANIVQSRSTSGYASFLANASTGNQAYHFFQVNSVETARITSDSGNVLTFSTGAALERMRIDSSGNVGIGGTPSYKLDVNGGALGTTAGNQVIVERLVTTTSNADSLEFSKIRNTNGTDWTTAGWRLQQKVDSTWQGYIQFNGNNNEGLSFGTGGSTVSANSISERMRIDNSGNVGIGTASPGYKLDINGTAAVRGVLYMANDVWNQTLDGKNRFYFATNNRTYFGSQNGYEWRSSTDTNLAVLENLGFFNVNGPVQSNYTATYGVAKLYMAGGYSQFGKDSGHRTDIVNTGGLDATGPFWTGYQWCPPDVITNSGGVTSFPRTSFYFNYSTVTNPSNMAFNMYVGNNNGIPIGINIGTESAGNINFITSGSTRLTVTSGGNLNFLGTAQRITGDFSNATRNNRVFFQTATANSATSVGVIPNGTSTDANFAVSNSSSNVDNSSVLLFGISASSTSFNSAKLGTGTVLPFVISVDSVMRLQFNTDGTISSFDNASAVGYKGTPVNEQAAAYTLVLADQGKSIVHPISDNNARTYTIPANGTVAFPVGTAITFINMINTVTISITTDTMYLAGVGTTGNRTLAAYGMATAVKVTATSWIISGNGLT